ncbi:FtsB family cell division protein [Knoellia koreensis]|uniref:Septum formation initiator family protein n=1 Tax=Knoellia koreensis TaxID=2730921 RepID=A0A849HJ36_9MICO|nr:septum formation initiator family protein [Knoellia sp. DB2414S]NNM46663.1 septum formation initiator family protein [Knoellia sp. DB2414S]
MATTGRGPTGGTPGRRPAPRRGAPAPRKASGGKAAAGKSAAKGGTAARPGAGPGRSRATAAGAARKAAATSRVGQERKTTRGVMRVVVLASIFVLLAVTLVPTLRSYLRQQGQIDALREQVASQRANVSDLQKEQARWNDKDYVVQQARERLKFVKVGEKSYTVIDGKPTAKSATQVAKAPAAASDHPWYGQLWESMRAADTAPTDAGAGTGK